MSAQHPLSEKWDRMLQDAFEATDLYLESKYGQLYLKRPNRPEDGETANPQMSGLFNLGASFTAGYGSEFGRGYAIDLEICTYEKVDPEDRRRIEEDAIEYLESELRKIFPDRDLKIIYDGGIYKIVGDFSLGQV